MPSTQMLRMYWSWLEIIYTEWITWTLCRYTSVTVIVLVGLVGLFHFIFTVFSDCYVTNDQSHVDRNADITVSCAAVGDRCVQSCFRCVSFCYMFVCLKSLPVYWIEKEWAMKVAHKHTNLLKQIISNLILSMSHFQFPASQPCIGLWFGWGRWQRSDNPFFRKTQGCWSESNGKSQVNLVFSPFCSLVFW